MALLETDTLSNQNLSSRLEIASLTAGQYYKAIQAHVYLDQIAGNGDYVIDITHQRGGAGTAFRTVNVTQSVESGVTSLKSVSLPFPVNSGDVVKVYVTGLGGDTTTPDTVVEWHDVSSPTVAENRAEMDSNSTQLAAIVADTNELQTDDVPGLIAALPTAAGNADAIWDEARSGHSTAGTYGESFHTIESGQAVTGTLSTTQMTTNLTEATDDHYNGRIVIWTSGNLLRQATNITDYDGATKKLTFTAITEAPSNGDKFIIV